MVGLVSLRMTLPTGFRLSVLQHLALALVPYYSTPELAMAAKINLAELKPVAKVVLESLEKANLSTVSTRVPKLLPPAK